MLHNLLVPLDGSELAEAALPAAVSIATSTGAGITLLHIIEEDAPHEVHHERHLAEPGEAQKYLDDVSARLVPAGLIRQTHVHAAAARDVAGGIVQHVEELAPDIVIMCAHGRRDIWRFLYGSLAQQVLASRRIPVLLVRPGQRPIWGAPGGRQILVPLDGEEEHERGLSLIGDIARGAGAQLRLMTVVQTLSSLRGERAAAASMLPGTASVMLSIEQENAQSYLDGISARLAGQGITCQTEIARGEPAESIVERATAAKVDMIALTTHGRKGTRAFWAASVAPAVIEKSPVPILLIPANEPE